MRVLAVLLPLVVGSSTIRPSAAACAGSASTAPGFLERLRARGLIE